MNYSGIISQIEDFKTTSEGTDLIREIITEFHASSFYDILYVLEHTGYHLSALNRSLRKSVNVCDIIDVLKERKTSTPVIYITECIRRKFPENALMCIRRILDNYGFRPSSWCLRCGVEVWTREWTEKNGVVYEDSVNLDNDEIYTARNNTVLRGTVTI